MEHKLQIHEFFVEGGESERSHVLLHITEPSTPEEREKGYFFAVCELNGASKEQIIRLQEIIDQIENNYYVTEDEFGKSAFEVVLEKVNHSGFVLTEENLEIHCLVGVIRQPEIIFSYYGEPTLNLFYKTKDGLFKVMELVNTDVTEDKNDNQLFSQVVQGKISPNDFLFAGTPDIAETFDADRLSKLLTSRPPRLSAEHLQKVLTEIKNGNSFGGLIINYVPTIEEKLGPIVKKSPVAKGSGARSLNHLFRTEKDTSQTLSSSFLPRLNERLKNVWQEKPEEGDPQPIIEERLRPETAPPADIQSTHRRPFVSANPHNNITKRHENSDWGRYLVYFGKGLKTLGRILLWLGMFIWAVLLASGNLLVNLFYLATNLKGRRREVAENFKRQLDHQIRMIRDLPILTKVLLVLAIAAIVIFAGNIIYAEKKSANEALAAEFNQKITLIRNKKDSAESALIYNDQTGALKELQEAKEIFTTLTCDNEKNTATCQGLSTDLENLSFKLRKLVVAETEIIFDWSGQSEGQKLEQIVKIGSKVIGFSSSTTKLFVFDELTKKGEVLTAATTAGFTLGAAPKENDYALFVYNKKELIRFTPGNNALEKIDVSFGEASPDLGGLVVYNRRLYTVDKSNGMIYKHDSIKNGFGKGNNWLTSAAANFEQAIDLTIDGDIFVLQQNGDIQKFTKGQKQNFVVEGLEPALKSPQKIWSYNDLNYIYIIEPSEKRIVMLEKDGRVKQQLTSKEFTNPTGLVVIEEDKTLYTLNNNRLLKLTWK
ncbi:MAG TPA: hypothetical protein VJH75_03825 [Patescibacteria group bacterium]|nr:hypothetical protein [Patescibacteria group bacterium]